MIVGLPLMTPRRMIVRRSISDAVVPNEIDH